MAHILTGRALLLGEESLSSEDWSIVERHIQHCEHCKRNVLEMKHNPTLQSLHEKLHPTVEEVATFAMGEEVAGSMAQSTARREDIREHLAICLMCREEYSQVTAFRSALSTTAADSGLKSKLLAGVERGKEVLRRLRVERIVAPTVSYASSTNTSKTKHQLAVVAEELISLGAQPQVLLEIDRQTNTLKFMIARPANLRESGSGALRQGTIEIRMIRSPQKMPITVKLGNSINSTKSPPHYFRAIATKRLTDYTRGEENHWEAEVYIRPNEVWRSRGDVLE